MLRNYFFFVNTLKGTETRKQLHNKSRDLFGFSLDSEFSMTRFNCLK